MHGENFFISQIKKLLLFDQINTLQDETINMTKFHLYLRTDIRPQFEPTES